MVFSGHDKTIFMPKKSYTQVGHTFHKLQTIRKRPSTFRFCMEGPLRYPNLKFLNSENVVLFFDPELPPDLFYGEIC
jgi:hypothetical protein